MSRWAHRVVRVVYAKELSFSLSEDTKLVDFLEGETLFSESLGYWGTGMFEIPLSILRRAVRNAKKLDLSTETVQYLRDDIEWAKKNGHEGVTYDCF